MTGGRPRPIYYREVVSVEKGSVIIRYKLPEHSKFQKFRRGSCSSAAMFQAWLGLVRYTTGELLVSKQEM